MPNHLLSASACAKAKPRKAIYYLNDGGGLRLQVHPNESKYWLFRYRLNGKESTYSLGQYPDLSLVEARRETALARDLVASGRNPSLDRKIATQSRIESDLSTFGAIAHDWLEHNRADWAANHLERNQGLLRRYLLPKLGVLPADEITEQMLLQVLRECYKNTPESARRARQVASQVFRFGKDSHRCKTNPASDLARSSLLKPVGHKPFAAIPKEELGDFLRALDNAGIEVATRVALFSALYTGLRDYAIRGALWGEIDLEAGTWTVPAIRMKLRREFRTSLPNQLVNELSSLYELTYDGEESVVFASYGKDGHLAENSLRIAMHRLGFVYTLHGFRSLMTDVLNEQSFNADAIERQLDHTVANSVRRSYLRTDFWDERIRMVQWYADWCDLQKNKRD
jgi:integrase